MGKRCGRWDARHGDIHTNTRGRALLKRGMFGRFHSVSRLTCNESGVLLPLQPGKPDPFAAFALTSTADWELPDDGTGQPALMTVIIGDIEIDGA